MITTRAIESTGGPTVFALSRYATAWKGIHKRIGCDFSDYELSCEYDDYVRVFEHPCGGEKYLVLGQEPYPSMFWSDVVAGRYGILRSYAVTPFSINERYRNEADVLEAGEVSFDLAVDQYVLFDSSAGGPQRSSGQVEFSNPKKRSKVAYTVIAHPELGDEIIIEFIE
jgi:hypothetical protein